MRKTKKLYTLMLVTVMAFLLCACSVSSSKSYTFQVETGDKIKVTLDTSTGLSLTQKDGRFGVEKDDEIILQGMFLHEDTYNQYLEIKGQQGMTVLEDSQKDGNTYYMYEIKGEAGTEDNFVLWVKDSNTGVLMGSISGKENAKEAFEKLTIELES